ncbi:hypothetical protein CTAYLR_007193 [Chrysophaeum taylorii]|uniref:HAD family hydrolase n=1 Tax=Chrysophaeum taylorii TaxID=2483200 RepID=A0AAD7UNX3_9STRA|nr:hypothetical protein CTAYLR_007193 [Chrysophaeum taylorii]
MLIAVVVSSVAALRVVTFDLDDTLWPTEPVVQAANGALEVAMASVGVAGVDSATMQARIKLCRDEADGTYSELRRRAIASLVPEGVDADALFAVWLAARHRASAELLFDGVVDALREIRSDFVIGAITNGRGNPREMPALRDYFDFCVSGEDMFPHRKPSPRIFEAALEVARRHGGDVGWWVHVGDDLVNDVQGAAAVGARTVWFDDPNHFGDAGFTTKSPAERAERQARAAQILASEVVGARILSIPQLPGTLKGLFVGALVGLSSPPSPARGARGAAELDLEYYARGVLGLDRQRDIFSLREPREEPRASPRRSVDPGFAAAVVAALGETGDDLETACRRFYEKLSPDAASVGDRLFARANAGQGELRDAAQEIVDAYSSAGWIESGVVAFSDGDNDDPEPRALQVTLKGPITAPVAASLEQQKGIAYHPDLVGLTIASLCRRRNLNPAFDEYLLDDTYKTDPRAFVASSVLLLFPILD